MALAWAPGFLEGSLENERMNRPTFLYSYHHTTLSLSIYYKTKTYRSVESPHLGPTCPHSVGKFRGLQAGDRGGGQEGTVLAAALKRRRTHSKIRARLVPVSALSLSGAKS